MLVCVCLCVSASCILWVSLARNPAPAHTHTQVGLFFTASREKCGAECDAAFAQYALAAALFQEQHDMASTPPDKLIFFFVISAQDSLELFQSLGIKFAPQLFVIGPKSASDPKQSLSDFLMHPFEEPDLVQAIAAKAGVEVSCQRSYFHTYIYTLIFHLILEQLSAGAHLHARRYCLHSIRLALSIMLFCILFCVLSFSDQTAVRSVDSPCRLGTPRGVLSTGRNAGAGRRLGGRAVVQVPPHMGARVRGECMQCMCVRYTWTERMN
jgi:hypothetical protein